MTGGRVQQVVTIRPDPEYPCPDWRIEVLEMRTFERCWRRVFPPNIEPATVNNPPDILAGDWIGWEDDVTAFLTRDGEFSNRKMVCWASSAPKKQGPTP